MNETFRLDGTLTVGLGEGYLSSFEVSTLRPGDVVRTNAHAGDPQLVLFNGEELAQGEMLILHGIVAVRIVSLAGRHARPPIPGAKDELIELLPTLVSLGSIHISLADLEGVGAGTIISLGRELSEDEDAELVAAGIVVAAGKVVGMGEEMGLRLTRVFESSFKEDNIRASGYLAGEGGATCVDYDFRKPDRFSRNVLAKMAAIHDSFVRNLRAALPELAPGLPKAVGLERVDQCTYGEAIAKWGAGLEALVLENRHGRRGGGVEPESSTELPRGWKAFIEAARPARRVPAQLIEHLSSRAGGYAHQGGRMVLVRYRAVGPVASALSEPAGQEVLASCLRGGWKNLVDLNFSPLRREGEEKGGREVAQRAPLPENEMVVSVTIADREDGRPELVLLYPYLALEPYLGILS